MAKSKKQRADDDSDVCVIPLDNLTAIWLARLSQVTGDPPGEIVASMLRAIRVDDEAAEDPCLPAYLH